MFIINFSSLLDGEMFSNSYTYHFFSTAMNMVDDIMHDYADVPINDGDCWSITVFYNTHAILTLNSAMF